MAETHYDKKGNAIGFENSRGEFEPFREVAEDDLTQGAFESQLKEMRLAAAEVGAEQEFLQTEKHLRDRVVRDPRLRGFQSYGGFLSILRPFAMRNPDYVQKSVSVSVRDKDGKLREARLSREDAEKRAKEARQFTFQTQRAAADRMHREMLDVRRRHDAEGGRRAGSGKKYDVSVENAREAKDFVPEERNARVATRRRRGSVLDAVRALPARVRKSVTGYVPDEDRRLGTYEDAAAARIRSETEARTTKRDFMGLTREAFVDAAPDKSGRALPGSKQWWIDRGRSPQEAKELANRAYERQFANKPGSIAWFKARGFSDERARELSEEAHARLAGVRARETRSKERFKAGSEEGSRAYWMDRDFSAREADALADVAYARSYVPTGTMTSEATRRSTSIFWRVTTAPFRPVMRGVGAGVAKARATASDAAARVTGRVKEQGVRETAKDAGRAAANAAKAQAEKARADYRQARDPTADALGGGRAARAAGAAAGVGYAGGKRTFGLIPGWMLGKATKRHLANVAKDAGVARANETRGVYAARGAGVVATRAFAGIANAFRKASVGTRITVLVALVLLVAMMPTATLKYGIHFAYMLVLAGVDFLLIAPFNAVLQLVWFGYDVIVNVFLNFAVNGIVGLVKDVLIDPLSAGLEKVGIDAHVVRPTFQFLGTTVPQLAYWTTAVKAQGFMPELVPVDAYGNFLVGPELDVGWDDVVTEMPPIGARAPTTEGWHAWWRERLQHMTGCNPEHESCWDRWHWDLNPDGTVAFNFDAETQGPALFPGLIVPPNVALESDGFGKAVVPEVTWLAWDDRFHAPDAPCWDANGNHCRDNNIIDQGEATAATGFGDAAGRSTFNVQFSDSLLSKVVGQSYLLKLDAVMDRIGCRMEHDNAGDQDACIAKVDAELALALAALEA